MLAAQYATAGPERGRLQIVELERPTPGPGEVLVRMRLSGVNPTDWKSRGSGGVTSTGHAFVIPNQDGAGKVVEVGTGVDAARVGERVWLWQAQWRRAQGTAAQWVALSSEQAVPLPGSASLELGAGLGIPAMTAHRCLMVDGPIVDTAVLVQGGAGAVGHAAIELARWAGARVAATVSSPEKAELARAAGAELVIDYRRENVVDAVRAWESAGVARIIEVDLPGNVQTDAEVLAPGGVISSYAAAATPFEAPRALMTLNAAIEWVLVYTIPERAKRAAVADITRAMRDCALTALPGPLFPLERIADAHDAVEQGAVGKVLVEIPDPAQ